jgi:4'-phosphopantetheinyl transferase
VLTTGKNDGLELYASWQFEEESRVVAARLWPSSGAAEVCHAELSAAELSRAARFAFEHDRERFVIARAGLRRLLSQQLGVPAASIELTCGENGKPTLGGRLADSALRFNVTHTRDVVVYAFAWKREIGVDVEHLRALPNASAIAARFLSTHELAEFEALGAEDRATGFFNYWTRKEALAKAIGTGLSSPPTNFDVSPLPGSLAQRIRVRGVSRELCHWHLHGFRPGRALIGACVVSADSVRGSARRSSERRSIRMPSSCS